MAEFKRERILEIINYEVPGLPVTATEETLISDLNLDDLDDIEIILAVEQQLDLDLGDILTLSEYNKVRDFINEIEKRML